MIMTRRHEVAFDPRSLPIEEKSIPQVQLFYSYGYTLQTGTPIQARHLPHHEKKPSSASKSLRRSSISLFRLELLLL